MDTALKNHVFTSYPLGAYLNAAVNPLLLYFRILKKNLAGRSKAQLKPKVVVIKAERQTATIVDKKAVNVENVAVVQPLDVDEFKYKGDVSFVTSFISRMSSAHQLLKRSLTWTTTVKELKTKVEEKDFVALEEVRPPPVVVDTRRESLLKTLTIRPMKVLNVDLESATPGLTSATNLTVTPSAHRSTQSPNSDDHVIIWNNSAESFAVPMETALVGEVTQVNDPLTHVNSSQTDGTFSESSSNVVQSLTVRPMCVAKPIQTIIKRDLARANSKE